MSNIQDNGDAEAILTAVRNHVWSVPKRDIANGCHIWTCSCGHPVYQLFDEPAPDELLGHPQSFGQMRGE